MLKTGGLFFLLTCDVISAPSVQEKGLPDAQQAQGSGGSNNTNLMHVCQTKAGLSEHGRGVVRVHLIRVRLWQRARQIVLPAARLKWNFPLLLPGQERIARKPSCSRGLDMCTSETTTGHDDISWNMTDALWLKFMSLSQEMNLLWHNKSAHLCWQITS